MTEIRHQIATTSGAIFSPCGRYRYLLWRRWDDMFNPDGARWFLFAGANPSKANAKRSDPTVSQMRGRAQRMGCTGLLVVNANAYVSTDPKGLVGLEDPCGPENALYIATAAGLASFIVAGWGDLAGAAGRRAATILGGPGTPIHSLGVTQAGNPRHPRGVALSVVPSIWTPVNSSVEKLPKR